MITILICLTIIIFFIIIQIKDQEFYSPSIYLSFFFIFITLAILFTIDGKIISTETNYEQLVTINHYYVDDKQNIVTTTNRRMIIDNFNIILKDSDTTKPVYLKVVKENRVANIWWQFNSSPTYKYSIVFNKDE